MKKNKTHFLLWSLVILIPIIIALIVFWQINSQPKSNANILDNSTLSQNNSVIESEPIATAVPDAPVVKTDRVFMFYYLSYGTKPIDGQWIGWNKNIRFPPEDIASSYYPLLGPYSSISRITVSQHMKWIKDAGVDVVVVSWGGRQSRSDNLTPMVMDAAGNNGLKVAFQIEYYPKRTGEKIDDDMKYIIDHYGSHPAFLRVSRPTKYGNSTQPRPVFYILDSSIGINAVPAARWRIILDSLHNDTKYDSIVLGETQEPCFIDGCNDLAAESHFDGIYTFNLVKKGRTTDLSVARNYTKNRNSIFSATVSPGYDSSRGLGDYRIVKRINDSAQPPLMYDYMWGQVILAQPEWVTINSFNNWLEGTQVEPAEQGKLGNGYAYGNYTYGSSQDSYLYMMRTAQNINTFLATT